MSAIPPTPQSSRGTGPRSVRSVGELVGDLTSDTVALMRQEVALAKAEIGEKADQVKTGVASIVGAAVVLLLGLIVLMDAVVYGLGELLPPQYSPWLAALIVGGVLACIGAVMLKAGKDKLEPAALTPTRTARNLRRDADVVKEKASELTQ